jgi:hypothetical protein
MIPFYHDLAPGSRTASVAVKQPKNGGDAGRGRKDNPKDSLKDYPMAFSALRS